jgi:phospholipase C
MSQAPIVDPIEHVVVLILENHSFDQMLGALQAVYPMLDGIEQAAPPRINTDREGRVYEQAPMEDTAVDPDPRHELAHVLRQIEFPAPTRPGPDVGRSRLSRALDAIADIIRSWLPGAPTRRAEMRAAAAPEHRGNFVMDYALSHPDTTQEQRQRIMGYYPLDFLGPLHTLARHFTVCDQWFSSVPGPTWPNRFFALTGTSLGIVRMPDNKWDLKNWDIYDQPTIFDRLNAADISWKVYYGDVPQSWALLHQLEQENKRRYVTMEQFDVDAAGPVSAFPKFSFIEPRYFPPDQDDDHPPHDTMRAQALIARVYNGIRSNEELWRTTLLVIVYDEHGGFYDHVRPPESIAPDGHLSEYSFDRLGVRVPALLVSPWTAAGVNSTLFDHTSLLRYLISKWGLDGLGNRVAQANSIGVAIQNLPQSETPGPILTPPLRALAMAPGAESSIELNAHQEALIGLAKHVDPLNRPARAMLRARAFSAAASPLVEIEEAKAAVQRFREAE